MTAEEITHVTPTEPLEISQSGKAGDAGLSPMKSERTREASIGKGQESTSLGEKIKNAGLAGTIAYIITEIGFWALGIPVIVSSYHASTGDWLSFTDAEERSQILKLTAGFAGAARLAVPLRLSLAVLLTPKVKNILKESRLVGYEDDQEDTDFEARYMYVVKNYTV